MDFGFALIPNGILFGVEYYPIEGDKDYSELNIYLVILVIHFRVYLWANQKRNLKKQN